MKKYLALLLVIIISLPMFVMCGGGDKNTVVISSYMSDPEPKRVFDEIVEMFKKENPDLKVVVNTNSHEDFKTMIRTLLPSNSAPDVVTWFAGERMRNFAQQDLLEPIDDVFEGGFDKEFPEAFKTASSYNGKIYFLPQSWYWWGVYYRKSVFEEQGITPPTTWAEFTGVCEKLKNNGITPIAIGTKGLWTAAGWFDYLNMRVNGLDFHTKLTAGEVPYTDPKVKKALSYLGELSDKGYFLENHTSYAWQSAATYLFNKSAGMYLMGQFIADASEDDEIKADMDFFRFPIIDGNVRLYEDTPLDGFMMPKKARHKENGKKFLKFLASKKIQEYFAKELGRLAANKNVDPPNAQAKKGLNMILNSEGVMQFYDRDTRPEMANIGMNGFVEYMNYTDKLDIILEEIEKDRKRIYEEEEK